MKKIFPKWKFMGIDIDEDALLLAKEKNPDVRFIKLDVLEMDHFFAPKSFDCIFGIQFINFVSFDFVEFLKKARPIVRKYLFFSALFAEGWTEQHSIAYDIEHNWKGIYKIYSLDRS